MAYKRRILKYKGHPWSVRKLHRDAHCPRAFVLWTALLDLHEQTGRKVLTPTHALLSYMTGLKCGSAISTALSALHNAGWLTCEVYTRREGNEVSRVLRVTLRRGMRKFKTKPAEDAKPETIAAPREPDLPKSPLKTLAAELITQTGPLKEFCNILQHCVGISSTDLGHAVHLSTLEDVNKANYNSSLPMFRSLFNKHMCTPVDRPVSFTVATLAYKLDSFIPDPLPLTSPQEGPAPASLKPLESYKAPDG